MKDNKNTSVSKQKKLEIIFNIISKYKISNYEISQNTGISEAGLGSITNGDTKNPRELTVNAIFDYLVKTYTDSEKVIDTVEYENEKLIPIPIDEQISLLIKQNEELKKELLELRQEIRISNLITEISLSSIMVTMGIKKPDVNPESKTKPKSESV
ncbi:hypothetical protein J2O09_05735 [Elizabethkingia anophelis]|uniref:hypothetical protein n=1 Tax=Elizabethkingia anophelis TaxID=1117645 RepID=UPI0020B7E485|nr:hypothetical protein [Elizabethkingia anophelis]MCT4024347.1 hypothetical protein [Elizabethkingia anophelis]UTG62457.1 hypothetical protein J2O09_05735 [Elizabethkingia anophelis]UXM68741.1 hypothetical protein N7E57_05750 [Elizabethkingia anophelis]